MHQFFGAQVSLWSNSHDHTWLLEKQKLNYGWIFVGKVMSLLFTMLSRLVIIFLPKSRRLLISWLQLLSVVILVPKQIKSVTVSIVSQYTCHEVMPSNHLILCLPLLLLPSTFPSIRVFSNESVLYIRWPKFWSTFILPTMCARHCA